MNLEKRAPVDARPGILGPPMVEDAAPSDARSACATLLDDHGLKIIQQWEEYPGFVACELDLAVFMTVPNQFDRDK